MGKEAEGRAEPVQIKLRPKGVGIGFSDDEVDEKEEENVKEIEDQYFNDKSERGKNKVIKAERFAPVPLNERKDDFEINFLESHSITQVIDMQKHDLSITPMPLSSILKGLGSQKRREKAVLSHKKFELDASLQALKRNIEEVEKERKRLAEIEKKNQLKRQLAHFFEKRQVFKGDFDLLCSELENINFALVKDESFDEELFERVVCAVLGQILNEDQLMNPDQMAKLKMVLSIGSTFEKIVFHLWWPLMRSSYFSSSIEDSTAWQNIRISIADWAHLLPQNFLTLFIGNQILIPRFHALLRIDDEIFKDYQGGKDELVLDIWELMRNKLKLESANIILIPEIVTWFQDRIQRVSCGDSFEYLLRCFVERWQKNKLLPSSELKRLKERAWLARIQKLIQRELEIDPSDQDLKPIDSSIAAYQLHLLSKTQFIDILSDHLIPKLKRCVQKWLKSPSVDFEEVAEWYVGWKEYLPTELLADEENRLIEGFGEVLEVINKEL